MNRAERRRRDKSRAKGDDRSRLTTFIDKINAQQQKALGDFVVDQRKNATELVSERDVDVMSACNMIMVASTALLNAEGPLMACKTLFELTSSVVNDLSSRDDGGEKHSYYGHPGHPLNEEEAEELRRRLHSVIEASDIEELDALSKRFCGGPLTYEVEKNPEGEQFPVFVSAQFGTAGSGGAHGRDELHALRKALYQFMQLAVNKCEDCDDKDPLSWANPVDK